MLGVNRSSHLSAVGDPNPVIQAPYLVASPIFCIRGRELAHYDVCIDLLDFCGSDAL
jgi:hypothetical protein